MKEILLSKNDIFIAQTDGATLEEMRQIAEKLLDLGLTNSLVVDNNVQFTLLRKGDVVEVENV